MDRTDRLRGEHDSPTSDDASASWLINYITEEPAQYVRWIATTKQMSITSLIEFIARAELDATIEEETHARSASVRRQYADRD